MSVAGFAAMTILLAIIMALLHSSKWTPSPKELASMKFNAERGDYEAAGKLAWIYEEGLGTKKDYEEAYFFNSIAAAETAGSESATSQQHAAADSQHLTAEQKFAVDMRVNGWIKAHPNAVRLPQVK